MKRIHKCKLRRAWGFSVVEALVGILISTILLAGVLQIFVNSKMINNMETNFSEMQENARFAISYMSRIIRLSGYRTPPSTATDFTSITTVFPSSATYVAGTNGSSSVPDTLIIRYQGDGTVRDCLNTVVTSGVTVTNTFTVDTTTNSLQCRAQTSTTNTIQTLITGVENMQVLYGEDLDGNGTADRYVAANFTGLDMNKVVSVRVSLLLRSSDPVSPNQKSVTYNVNNQSIVTASTDAYLRYLVTFTTTLRNITSRTF